MRARKHEVLAPATVRCTDTACDDRCDHLWMGGPHCELFGDRPLIEDQDGTPQRCQQCLDAERLRMETRKP